jgi:hypothetical protein
MPKLFPYSAVMACRKEISSPAPEFMNANRTHLWKADIALSVDQFQSVVYAIRRVRQLNDNWQEFDSTPGALPGKVRLLHKHQRSSGPTKRI